MNKWQFLDFLHHCWKVLVPMTIYFVAVGYLAWLARPARGGRRG